MRTDAAESRHVTFVVVEDDPFDTAYLMDALTAVAPEAGTLAFDDLAAALHTLAMAHATGRPTQARNILLIDAGLLTKERQAIREALRRLRLLAPLRVVALMNSDDRAARQQAFLSGADEAMCRPADPLLLARLAQRTRTQAEAA